MTNTPKQAAASARGAITPPPPADYMDEMTTVHIDTLRSCAPQDESKMGALVHELSF